MRLILLTFLLFVLVSCKQESKLKPDYIFVRSEVIEHFMNGENKTQLVKTSFSNGEELIIDSIVIVKSYNSEKLVEQVEYNIEQGDSIIWRHLVNEYSTNDNLISEMDSVDGLLSRMSNYYFNSGKEIRAEHLNILYVQDYEKASFEVISVDTLRSIVYSYYDENGNCTTSKAVSMDNVLSGLYEEVTPDTTISYHSYDERGNKVKTISTTGVDTISVSTVQYNEANKVIADISVSNEYGTTMMQFEYDELGNKFTEVITADGISERTDYKYDSANRVISSITYKRIETLVNNTYE